MDGASMYDQLGTSALEYTSQIRRATEARAAVRRSRSRARAATIAQPPRNLASEPASALKIGLPTRSVASVATLSRPE